MAPGTVRKRRIAPPERVRVSGGPRSPEQATSIWEKVARWPATREDAALRAETGPSRHRLSAGLAGRGTLG
eukprot:6431389-Alexandrium_andersonii.AAC.1